MPRAELNSSCHRWGHHREFQHYNTTAQPHVSNRVRSGKLYDPDLARRFGDPDGVQGAVNLTWKNLPNKPAELTINNPDNYDPPGSSIERITMTGLANWAPPWSISFTNSSTLLATMSLLWADLDEDNRYPDWPNTHVLGEECGLYLCVKRFDTAVVNGTVTQNSTEVSSKRKIASYQQLGAIPESTLVYPNLWDPDLDTIKRTDLEIELPEVLQSSGDRSFSITQAGVCGLINEVNKALDDGTMWWYQQNTETGLTEPVMIIAGITGMVRLVPTTQKLSFEPQVMQALWENRGHEGLSTLFENVAASLTNNIRASADNATSIPGHEGVITTIYQIRWPWIVPTAVAVILA
ncbi:hypothetical protein H2200_011043 [Cladophialophora chaetospira]|uniref:Uncharacterized protein n=1 Tax=Cladophialophora chaetospira TaxID=386627 RepID=A0AA38WZW1_9EURO|nr:hypothetical protein H2200_011043 [Cladophialophora chaetospira]